MVGRNVWLDVSCSEEPNSVRLPFSDFVARAQVAEAQEYAWSSNEGLCEDRDMRRTVTGTAWLLTTQSSDRPMISKTIIYSWIRVLIEKSIARPINLSSFTPWNGLCLSILNTQLQRSYNLRSSRDRIPCGCLLWRGVSSMTTPLRHEPEQSSYDSKTENHPTFQSWNSLWTAVFA